MKTQFKILIALVVVLAVVLFFQFRNSSKNEGLAIGARKVKVKEVLQTSQYTYVYVAEGREKYWCAITKAQVEAGQTYYWRAGMEMKDFKSRELNRTFPSVFFVEDFTDKPILAESLEPQIPNATTGRQMVPQKEGIAVDRAEGGITVAELFANRNDYTGKTIKIKGEVVKFSPGIMNRNWIHMQDGTQDGTDYDLVVTTTDTVAVGTMVTIEGTVALDQDFGFGYTYELLVQDALVH
jgi:hypothetical protein